MRVTDLPNIELAEHLKGWEGTGFFGQLPPLTKAILIEIRNRLETESADLRAQVPGVPNANYLRLSEVTLKPLPEGLYMTKAAAAKVDGLLNKFGELAAEIDGLKKYIFYGDPLAAKAEDAYFLPTDAANVLHAVMGMVGELGEVLDATSPQNENPTEEDYQQHRLKLIKELGDFRWYEAILHRTFNTTAEEIHEVNINKLKARYPEGFSNDAALARADVTASEGVVAGKPVVGDDPLGR